jgi:hypothetical protein
MAPPADDLFQLARADIGLAVALAGAKQPEERAVLTERQRRVQKQMRQVQRQLISRGTRR